MLAATSSWARATTFIEKSSLNIFPVLSAFSLLLILTGAVSPSKVTPVLSSHFPKCLYSFGLATWQLNKKKVGAIIWSLPRILPRKDTLVPCIFLGEGKALTLRSSFLTYKPSTPPLYISDYTPKNKFHPLNREDKKVAGVPPGPSLAISQG